MLWFILVLHLIQPTNKFHVSHWTKVVADSNLTLMLTIKKSFRFLRIQGNSTLCHSLLYYFILTLSWLKLLVLHNSHLHFFNHAMWKPKITQKVLAHQSKTMNLTGGNWQKWKRVFLTCPCHKIYRDEAVGRKSCKNTWKITIFVKMWNLGQHRENLIFCQ